MNKTLTIAVGNLGGGDATDFLFDLLKQVPKGSKCIVVEFPCLGIPRIAYGTQNTKIAEIKKDQTIDQLFLDYDRHDLGDIKQYLFNEEQVDYLLINPRSLQENPVVRRMNSNKTLIDMPLYLKQQLQDEYQFVFFVTQGTLIHPTTHFSLRVADAAVLYSANTIDFVGNVTNYNRLIDVFGVAKERLFLYSGDPHIEFKEAPIYKKCSDLFKKLLPIDPLPIELVPTSRPQQSSGVQESIGQIEPIEYLNYKFHTSDFSKEISQTEEKSLQLLTAAVRGKLQANHLDDYVRSLTNDDSRQKIRYLIADIVKETTGFSINMKIEEVIHWVQREITELGILQPYLTDKKIANIDINAPDQIIIDEDGVEREAPVKFQSEEHYFQTINKICEPLGKSLTGNEPIIDLNYKGFRMCVVADKDRRDGVSARYPLVSIRKFPEDVFTDEQCIAYGNLNQEMAEFEADMARCANIVVAGGTDSGKTTTLTRLPLYVPRLTRILSIEDSEEMMLALKKAYRDYPNLPSLLVKHVVGDEDHSYGIASLIKAALRLRPKVIAIGEMRDAMTAVQALVGMNTGHRVWTTLHSNSVEETPVRLVQLNGNTPAAAAQVASSIDIMIYQERLENGKRVQTGVGELLGYEGTTKPIINNLFEYDFELNKHVRVGNVQSPALIKKMKAAGIPKERIQRWCAGYQPSELVAAN